MNGDMNPLLTLFWTIYISHFDLCIFFDKTTVIPQRYQIEFSKC